MIDRLPKSYDELSFKTYVAIINKIPSEQPAGISKTDWSRLIHLATLSILLGIPEDEIEALKAVKVLELIKGIDFLNKLIEPTKNDFKVKSMKELSYDEFSTYQSLRLDQWNNLEEILNLVLKNVTPEQVAAFSIQDAMNVFFCLNKSTKKYFRLLKYWTAISLIWKATIQIATFWRKKDSTPKKNFVAVGVG